MHQYLKAIGFGIIDTKKKVKEILEEVTEHPTSSGLVSYTNDCAFSEYKKSYGKRIGIAVCGELDGNDQFEGDYYTPYFVGAGITSYSDVVVERRIEKEAYVGICEDIKVGVSLIFHLQNSIDYIREREDGNLPKLATTITLSGLALSGTVLFPIRKNPDQERLKKEESRNRMMLLSAAKNGDLTAIESLTLDDIDTYSKVSQRLVKEDIFTIVDSYFMPYGVECDQYSVMGEIIAYETIVNQRSKVELMSITLEVNELVFDVCVPKEDILGELQLGRRFKTNIWLQGTINF